MYFQQACLDETKLKDSVDPVPSKLRIKDRLSPKLYYVQKGNLIVFVDS